MVNEYGTYIIHTRQKLYVYFRGPLFTPPWLNLQHWTGFHIAVYGNFQGLFFIFQGSFLHFGGKIARSSCVFFPWYIHTCRTLHYALSVTLDGHRYVPPLSLHKVQMKMIEQTWSTIIQSVLNIQFTLAVILVDLIKNISSFLIQTWDPFHEKLLSYMYQLY